MAVVALYAAVAAATLLVSGRSILPLFEGIGPTAPYRWVDPPPEFAAGNAPPTVAEVEVPLDDTGSRAAGPGTDDAQLVLALPAGAVLARTGETGVLVRITPLAPADVAPPPDGLRPDGNAYLVELEYLPSRTQVGALARDGNVVLSVPEPAASLLYSIDGDTWEPLDTSQLGGSVSVGGRFEGPGYFLAAALPAPTGSSDDDAVEVVAVAAVTAALALVLVLAPQLASRFRRQDTP